MTAHDQFTLHLDRGERYAFEVSLDWERVRRCFGLFEDYCVVTAGVRNGIPVSVVIVERRRTVPAGRRTEGTGVGVASLRR